MVRKRKSLLRPSRRPPRRPAGGEAVGLSKISDLTPDPRNAGRHGPRDVEAIAAALAEVGAASSIDEQGSVLAEDATVLQAFGRAGFAKVHVVDADGSPPCPFGGSGSREEKARLAVYDNRSAEARRRAPRGSHQKILEITQGFDSRAQGAAAWGSSAGHASACPVSRIRRRLAPTAGGPPWGLGCAGRARHLSRLPPGTHSGGTNHAS